MATFTGDNLNNSINGSFENDLIYGLGGNDNLTGDFGDDIIYGGDGKDTLDGGYGFDTLDGGNGIDTVTYDFYSGGINANLQTGVVSFPGNSTLTDKLISIENIIGSQGNDVIFGNNLNNYLWGNLGDDAIYGGDGKDTLDGGYGFDTLDGGNGIDTVTYDFYSGGINANLQTGVVSFPGNSTLTDKLISIENIIGSRGNDVIVGDSFNNSIKGNLGNDTLDGGYGFDTIDGGAGIDTTTYDFYSGGIIANLQTGVVSFPGNSTLTDKLISIENIIGSRGNDYLSGNAVNNILNGNLGDDTIYGGAGADTVIGGEGADTFVFKSSREGVDTIQDFNWQQGDKIQIANSGFAGLTGITDFAYNSTTGALSYKGTALANLSLSSGFNLNRDLVFETPLQKRVSFDNVNFSTTGQSIWDSGPAFTFSDSRFLGGSWNQSGSATLYGGLRDPFFGTEILPSVGVSGSTSGKVGFQSDFRVNGGTVNAKLPIDIWVDVPTQVKAGQVITIKSGFNVDRSASFSTLGPNATYDLDLIFGTNTRADLQVGSSSKNLVNVNVAEKRYDLLSLNAQNTTFTIPESVLGGYGSLSLHVPELNSQGGVAATNTLSSSVSDSFLQARLDLDKIATSLANYAGLPIPPFEGSVSANLGLLSGSLGYNLADFELAPSLTVQQKFDLTAKNLGGKLILENGSQVDFKVGQDVSFVVPDGVGDSLGIQAMVNPEVNLGNTTSLGYDVDFDITALSAYLNAKLGSITLASAEFGPLVQQHYDLFSGTIADLYKNTFSVGGFNSQAFNFDVAVG